MTRIGAAIIALALIPQPGTAEKVTRARYLMGTVCEVSASRPEDITAALDEAARIERFLSTWREDSELSRLNRGDAAAPSPELRSLLARVDGWRALTGGAFEPRVRPLIEIWRTRQQGAVPDRAAIDHALKDIRSGLGPIEEGAFGKGYAIDRMLRSADLVNFGGQVGVRGSTLVSVADPSRRARAILQFTLRDGSLSTSGGSEKTFEVAGHVFTHIIDPRTGSALPPRGSVSVVDDVALDADILSTALFVMGPREGLQWANGHHVAALFITPENRILLSAPFRERVHDLRVLDHHFTLKE